MTQDSTSRCSAVTGLPCFPYLSTRFRPEFFWPDVTDPDSDAALSSALSRLSKARADDIGPRAMVKFHQAVELKVTQFGTVFARGWPGWIVA